MELLGSPEITEDVGYSQVIGHLNIFVHLLNTKKPFPSSQQRVLPLFTEYMIATFLEIVLV
jgi:hypothetical protein